MRTPTMRCSPSRTRAPPRSTAALVMNHASVRALIKEGGAVTGAEIECAFTGRVVRAAARCVVNATGP